MAGVKKPEDQKIINTMIGIYKRHQDFLNQTSRVQIVSKSQVVRDALEFYEAHLGDKK